MVLDAARTLGGGPLVFPDRRGGSLVVNRPARARRRTGFDSRSMRPGRRAARRRERELDRPRRPRTMPAAAAVNRSPIICAESGTTRSGWLRARDQRGVDAPDCRSR